MVSRKEAFRVFTTYIDILSDTEVIKKDKKEYQIGMLNPGPEPHNLNKYSSKHGAGVGLK